MCVDFAHECHRALCTGWLQPEASNGWGKPTAKSMSEHLKDTHRTLKMVKNTPQKGMDSIIWRVSLMPHATIRLCNALRCVWSLSVQQIALSWEPVETIGSSWNLAGGNRLSQPLAWAFLIRFLLPLWCTESQLLLPHILLSEIPLKP